MYPTFCGSRFSTDWIVAIEDFVFTFNTYTIYEKIMYTAKQARASPRALLVKIKLEHKTKNNYN